MLLITAAVNSDVVAAPERLVRSLITRFRGNDVPPMSAVRTLPELTTSKVALAMLFARLSRLSGDSDVRMTTLTRDSVLTRDVEASWWRLGSWQLG